MSSVTSSLDHHFDLMLMRLVNPKPKLPVALETRQLSQVFDGAGRSEEITVITQSDCLIAW